MATRTVPLLIIQSRAQKLVPGQIILHKHTWHGHILLSHPEVEIFQVQDTLEDPDYICDSKTRPGDFVFVCEGNTNDHGEGMRVAVRTQDRINFVTSAYYSGSATHGTVLWSRGDG